MSKEKQIEEMAVDLCLIDRCKHLSKEECHNTTCAHCEAEALYNAGYRKQSEWISVEDRLPELYTYVITYDTVSGNVQIDSVLSNGEFVIGYNVTHWMSLPKPPKMKGGAE